MKSLSLIEKRYLQALGLLSGLVVGLTGLRIILTGTFHLWYVVWNLALAWVSLVVIWVLSKRLEESRWLSWQNVSLSAVWLIFLPNTWYVLTDFVHVSTNGEINQLFDIVLMGVLTTCGFILGFTSLFLMHKQFLKRFSERTSGVIIGLIIFISSFAIYIGRDLRWNSWDVVTNPSGIIISVSDRVIDPFGHPRAINMTGLFFVLISVMYLAIWIFFRPQQSRSKK
jgi:uncharacterized membrane protein